MGYSIAVDSTGSAWVTGATNSGNFPVKGNAYNTFLKGSQDGFVSRVSADGSQLLYSTYLGGENAALFAIAVDGAGNAYVAGYSASPDFPIVNGYQPVYPSNATRSGVVAKINPSASSSLVYSTYLGGANDGTILYAISVDGKGNIYAGGRTASPEFPVTANAVETVASFPNGQLTGIAAVVAELNPAAQAGAQLEYSTYLGGGTLDEVLGIGLDSSGRIVVGGTTGSPTFPTTPDAFQATYLGTLANGTYPNKGFVSVIDPTLSGTKGLIYSTFLGGHQSDTFNGHGGERRGHGRDYCGASNVVRPFCDSQRFPTQAQFILRRRLYRDI